jgi:hypothetical protein
MFTSISPIQLTVYFLIASTFVFAVIAAYLYFYFERKPSAMQFVLIPFFASMSTASCIAAMWVAAPSI